MIFLSAFLAVGNTLVAGQTGTRSSFVLTTGWSWRVGWLAVVYWQTSAMIDVSTFDGPGKWFAEFPRVHLVGTREGTIDTVYSGDHTQSCE